MRLYIIMDELEAEVVLEVYDILTDLLNPIDPVNYLADYSSTGSSSQFKRLYISTDEFSCQVCHLYTVESEPDSCIRLSANDIM